MAEMDLDVIIFRGRNREDRYRATADPARDDQLRGLLRTWLGSHRWQKSLWNEFSLVTFHPATGRRIEVRP